MKPIHENIKTVKIEDDETGDLIPVLEYAGHRFSHLVKAVVDTGRAGSLTLKITVRPSEKGAVAVRPDVRVTMPKGTPAEDLLWPAIDGSAVAKGHSWCA